MFEPIHSIAVMNTLALELFLQPLTYDLEFQDRNPFLLYKSNNRNYRFICIYLIKYQIIVLNLRYIWNLVY